MQISSLVLNVLFLFGDPILSGLYLPDAQKSGYLADKEAIFWEGWDCRQCSLLEGRLWS